MRTNRILTLIVSLLFCSASYAQLGFYLGIRGGAGELLTQDQVRNLATAQGFKSIFQKNDDWSIHGKGEALIGFWRVRLGYQFLYNFAGRSVNSVPVEAVPPIGPDATTTYFNSSQTHYFGHYFLAEIAAIKTRHFNLVPGIAVGSYTGFMVDNNTGKTVELSTDTHHRFSIGAELNGEVVFGRCTFLFGPNYYLFSMQNKSNDNWRTYQHFIGGDLGFRVNLIKPKS
jgi:hypothetical protein